MARIGPHWTKHAPAQADAERASRVLGGIPADMRWSSFGSADLRRRCSRGRPAAIHEAANSTRLFVVFVGDRGSGKTSLATAVYRADVEAAGGIGGCWVGAERLIVEALRESRLGSVAPLMNRARQARTLLLDDLGQEPEHEDSRALIADLVLGRWRDQKFTIVTTGLDESRIMARYGSGIHRRLTERGRVDVIVCTPEQPR